MRRWFYDKGTTVIAALMVLVMTACEYKDLQVGEGPEKMKFRLDFNWERVDSIPGSMRVVFYPEDASVYAKGYTIFDVLNSDTVIELPVGYYDVTAWNNDTEHNIYKDWAKRETVSATTGNYSPHGDIYVPKVLDSLYHGQKVLDFPDYMVHANEIRFALNNRDENQKLVLQGDSMVVTVDVKLNGIRGLEWCRQIRATLNNVAEKRYIGYENYTEDSVAVMFDGVANKKDSCVTARFWIYGKEPTNVNNIQHQMLVFFWITGNQVYFPLDVTAIMARARKEDKYILIETPDLHIDLKDYVKQGETGIIVDAEDWEETEYIPISF